MNRKLIHSAFSLVLLAGMSACQSRTDGAEDLSSYVNPFIGTSVKADTEQSFNSMGKTFPGAATPFGMTQVSPNTITGGATTDRDMAISIRLSRDSLSPK